MPTPETPGPNPEFTPKSEAQIKLEAKKEIKDTLALSPLWKDMGHDEQEQLAEDLFNRTFTVFLGEYERERRASETARIEHKEAA